MKKIVRKFLAGKEGVRKPVSFLMLALFFFHLGRWTHEKKFFGLKVHGDFRTLEPIVLDIPLNRSRVTKEDVLNQGCQKLWESGIKPDRPRYNSHYLRLT